jgi:hypothetical protein
MANFKIVEIIMAQNQLTPTNKNADADLIE